MKKNKIMKCFYSITIAILLGISAFSQNKGNLKSTTDTIVYWTFPAFDSIADGGNSLNVSKLILRDNSFTAKYVSPYPAGVSTYAISSSGWVGGSGTKYWFVEFNTTQYDSINVSSRQRSSGSGPRDFVVEYSLDASTWNIVNGTTIKCAASGFVAAGSVVKAKLPSECTNKSSVYLRWIMTSDSSCTVGGLVQAIGTSRMDNVYILGKYDPNVGVDKISGCNNKVVLYPNPFNDILSLNFNSQKNNLAYISVFDLTGKTVYKYDCYAKDGINSNSIDLKALAKGVYCLRIDFGNNTESFKIIKQ